MHERIEPAPMQTNPDNSPNHGVHAEAGAHVNVVRVEFGRELTVLIGVMIAIIAASAVIMGLDLARQEELQYHFDYLDRQYRMVELKLDDWTVVAHRAGLVLPGDYTRGPEGNLDAKSFHPKQLKGH